ncbi:hypothetical protein LTR62_003635 [Meristemomyces frigidus]|uniref:G-patch domain-containing protein n=1 Tax=Meristemomyces frigidus TaxID=1508187 RepID=A0AAN7YGM9_9PEZI|nr:hypothetical protein LTR62_003635 [Meristemomyces frigidus]
MATNEAEEDDYLSMSFGEPAAQVKENSLQRTARLKKEAAERARPLSKKERGAKEKAARDSALATSMDSSNKGAKMMAKMGFKGGALGKSNDARTQPIEVLVKDDRGGIGLDSEKKRKLRELAEEQEGKEKKRRVGEEEFRMLNAAEREERRTAGMMWSSMRTLEEFEADGVGGSDEGGVPGEQKKVGKVARPLRSINLLYRPLVKQRLEKEKEKRARYDLDQSLSRPAAYSDPDADADDKIALDTEVEEELDEEDAELDEFEALSYAQRLEKIVGELRQKWRYCFWCKYRYASESEMEEDCPGLGEDEHG